MAGSLIRYSQIFFRFYFSGFMPLNTSSSALRIRFRTHRPRKVIAAHFRSLRLPRPGNFTQRLFSHPEYRHADRFISMAWAGRYERRFSFPPMGAHPSRTFFLTLGSNRSGASCDQHRTVSLDPSSSLYRHDRDLHRHDHGAGDMAGDLINFYDCHRWFGLSHLRGRAGASDGARQ